MQDKSTKSLSDAQHEDFTDVLKDSIAQIIFYSTAALTIYFVGIYFWWFGFVLYILFLLLYVLPHLLLSGIVVLIITWISGLIFALSSRRRLSSEKSDEMRKIFASIGIGTILMVAQQVYFLGIFGLLGYFFFSAS